VLAVGIGAKAELIYGKLQAGIVFQTSWTVGLLLAVTPQSSVWPSTLIAFAKRAGSYLPSEPLKETVIVAAG
jgi:hypothetical protein